MKTAILGSKNLILPFKALGVETFYIDKESDFKAAKERITQENDFAILFISQKTAQKYEKEVEEFYNKPLPAVLIVPESGADSEQSLNKIFERALGRVI